MKVKEMTDIHQTAIIDQGAKIGERVKIGPYSVIGKNVVLGDDVEVMSHVCIDGITEIGAGTKIFPFASIGLAPQDKKFAGEESKTIIGKNNIIREYVTIQPGTRDDKMQTVVGDNNLFMVSCHVAHDCVVGNNVIMANNATLGGHVVIGDHVIIGGLSAVHQFTVIGEHSIIGGMSAVVDNVIPYGLVKGERAYLDGINIIGLKRRDFSKKEVSDLLKAFKMIFLNDDEVMEKRIERVANDFSDSTLVANVIKFLQKDSSRSLCLPKERSK